MALLLKHQTVEQFVTRVRQAYRDSEQDTLVVVARFIKEKLQIGDITDAQCRAAWGLSAAQWNQLKVKMNDVIAAKDTVRSAIGE